MRKSIGWGVVVSFALALVACEDVIFPELDRVEPVLVVDAFVTSRPGPQQIVLTRTQPYFENALPAGVSGAAVRVADSEGNVFDFLEEGPGRYVWSPAGNEVFGVEGRSYTLSVQFQGETFVAESRMGRVPPIDSITFFSDPPTQFAPEFLQAEFWAVDPPGSGDAYWIKTFKNGKFLNLPSDIILAYDAGFSRGSNFNGVPFIVPIRRAINPFEEGEDGRLQSPYAIGDSVYVEIHSLTDAAFDFLNELVIQTNRPGGFGELFATPLANVSTNLRNANPAGSKVVGFFNVANVSGRGRKLTSRDDLSQK